MHRRRRVRPSAASRSSTRSDAAPLDLSSLPGDRSPAARSSRPTVKRAFVERLPGVLVVDGYGTSETGGQGQSVTVAGGRDRERAPLPRQRRDRGARRRPRARRPAGVVGRLARRGHIPLGYYKDPEKTAATFPVVDGVRWSVPGDHAVVEDDGTITLLGRGSVSINTGGEKVYPEEVEAVLKAHAAVFDAVVVGVPDERFGERVVAVVQAAPGAAPTLAELQDARACARSPATRCRATSSLVDAIVRSPSGKPDYRWARARPATQLGLAIGEYGPGHAGAAVAEPTRGRDQPVPPPARRQPRRLVPVGRRGVPRSRASSTGPMFLSVGYSSCHWCHVMAHESFEDPETAALMNELFVNVKVDREERPDVDAVYMQAVQALTGRGGWPMSVWCTPDGRPFYGGTYFPNEDRHGMPSFAKRVRGRRRRVARAARRGARAGGQLTEAIDEQVDAPATRRSTCRPQLLARGVRQRRRRSSTAASAASAPRRSSRRR